MCPSDMYGPDERYERQYGYATERHVGAYNGDVTVSEVPISPQGCRLKLHGMLTELLSFVSILLLRTLIPSSRHMATHVDVIIWFPLIPA
jgi:hypothetical protein